MSASPPATRLARRLAALPEPAMRQRVLQEHLQRTPLEESVQVLDEIQRHGRAGGPPFNVALLAVAAVLGEAGLDYELRIRLYAAAKAQQLDELARLFFSPQPPPPQRRRGDEDRDLTLGHRKALARQQDRGVLERLLHDPELEVMPNLLANPRLVQQDVVLLAARRPAVPEIQRCIAASRRWIPRYEVKRALVLNPYTPTDISLRLLGFLSGGDLRLVRSSTSLAETVREAADQLLRSQGDQG